MIGRRLNIAVIGGGISGVAAAHFLAQRHDVTLFEKNEYLGGHTNTRIVEDPDFGPTPVDTGFIVCNARNYPIFYRLLDEWQVERRDSDMSFGFYSEETGLQYKGPSLAEFVQEPRNFFNPRFLRMILEQTRFNSRVLRDLRAGKLSETSLGAYLNELGASQYFVDHYLAPLIASVWSSPDLGAMNFPMATFATFFDNHGMLELRKRPQWQTIKGGSHEYLRAFARSFPGTVVTSAAIEGIQRLSNGVTIRQKGGALHTFDKVVLGTHADEALRLLSDADETEVRLLGAWRYNLNRTVLHTDRGALPPRKRLWASWNYLRRRSHQSETPVAITYYMNRLQGLKTKTDYFVTLNREANINPRSVLFEIDYHHPIYSPESVTTQNEILERNGERHTYFCGAYLGYGFHEDGVKSAAAAVESLERQEAFGAAA